MTLSAVQHALDFMPEHYDLNQWPQAGFTSPFLLVTCAMLKTYKMSSMCLSLHLSTCGLSRQDLCVSVSFHRS